MSSNSIDELLAFFARERRAIFVERRYTKHIVRGMFQHTTQAYVRFGTKELLTRVEDDDQLIVDLDEWAEENRDPTIPAGLATFTPWPLKTEARDLLVMIELDLRKRGAEEITNQLRSEAEALLEDRVYELFERMLLALAGANLRHAFGRASLNGRGHYLLVIKDGATQDVQARLHRAVLSQPLAFGPFELRVEIKRARKPDSRQRFILPGTLYPSKIKGWGPDLLRWRVIPQPEPVAAIEPPPPIEVGALVNALWGFAFAAGLGDYWQAGDRHNLAVLATGVLAHEAYRATDFRLDSAMTPPVARQIFDLLLDFAGDRERPDRLALLDGALAAGDAGQIGTIPGYLKFEEYLTGGTRPEGTLHNFLAYLKRLLTGADVAQLEDLLQNIIAVENSGAKRPMFLYVPTALQGRRAPLFDRQGLLELLENITMLTEKGPKPLAPIALQSRTRRRVTGVCSVPGIETMQMIYAVGDKLLLEPPTDASIPHATLANIAPAYATPVSTSVRDEDLRTVLDEFWYPHLMDAMNHKKACADYFEYFIAYHLQNPLERLQLACMLTGDQGTGKSTIVTAFLGPVLGSCAGSTGFDTFLNEQFAFNEAVGKRFLAIEEAHIDDGRDADNKRALFRRFLRSPMLHVNMKMQARIDIPNLVALLLFSNHEHPHLAPAGDADRTIFHALGPRRLDLGMSAEEFKREVEGKVRDRVVRLHHLFHQHERYLAYRQAFLHHLLTLPVSEENLTDMSASASYDSDHLEAELPVLERCLVEILQRGFLHERARHFSLAMPFTAEALADAVNTLRAQLGVSPTDKAKRSSNVLSREIQRLFGDEIIGRYELGRSSTDSKIRVSYFIEHAGELITRLAKRTGVQVHPDYAPSEGRNMPTEEQFKIAYDHYNQVFSHRAT